MIMNYTVGDKCLGNFSQIPQPASKITSRNYKL